MEPVIIKGSTLGKNWWVEAWNQNLESYADYSSRVTRGRTYVLSSAVLDLKLKKGDIRALVRGRSSRSYRVIISIDPVRLEKAERIKKLCHDNIDALEQLLDGKFPRELEVLLADPKYGLFPAPREIYFDCTCQDWAYMCKHVAAVLYGVGERLESDPMLFFELRSLDIKALLNKSMKKKLDNILKNAEKPSERVISQEDIFDIFGI